MNTKSVVSSFFICVILVGGLTVSDSYAAKNPALWKYKVKGDFSTVVENLKSGLESSQFIITNEEHLSKGLENNKSMLGGDAKWNTIGFDNVMSINFCSIVFNHEVFNIDMDMSFLCPFKVVLYNMKKSPRDITIITVKPTYLLKHGPAKNKKIGKKIERRIIDAIKSGVKLDM